MIDWHQIFAFDVPALEIIVRGTVIYLFLILVMRFGRNRSMGSIGVSDMLVIIIIADASQNAMSGTYNSIGDGIILILTIIFWDYLIDWVCYKVPLLENLLQRHQVCLIKNGRLQHRNMRSEMITKDELMGQLRVQGVDDIAKVKSACIELNGQVSVIKYKD